MLSGVTKAAGLCHVPGAAARKPGLYQGLTLDTAEISSYQLFFLYV